MIPRVERFVNNLHKVANGEITGSVDLVIKEFCEHYKLGNGSYFFLKGNILAKQQQRALTIYETKTALGEMVENCFTLSQMQEIASQYDGLHPDFYYDADAFEDTYHEDLSFKLNCLEMLLNHKIQNGSHLRDVNYTIRLPQSEANIQFSEVPTSNHDENQPTNFVLIQ